MTAEIIEVESLEGDIQQPSQKQMMFLGPDCYTQATNFLSWAKPQQVQIEAGYLDDGQQACRLTYNNTSLQ